MQWQFVSVCVFYRAQIAMMQNASVQSQDVEPGSDKQELAEMMWASFGEKLPPHPHSGAYLLERLRITQASTAQLPWWNNVGWFCFFNFSARDMYCDVGLV